MSNLFAALALFLSLEACAGGWAVAPSFSGDRFSPMSAATGRAKQILVLFEPPGSHLHAIGAFPATGNGELTPSSLIHGEKAALYGIPSTLLRAPLGRIFTCRWEFTGDKRWHIVAFAPTAHGDVAPVRNIGGSNNPLRNCTSVAVGGMARVAAAGNDPSDSVFLWGRGLNGNAKPSQALAGRNTDLDDPRGLGFDESGNLYVVNNGYPSHRPDTVTVYAPDASGNARPLRKIEGLDTQIDQPNAIAIRAGMIYVFSLGVPRESDQHITAYKVLQSGDVKPAILIEGPKTHLGGGSGLAIDAAGFIYVNNHNHILVFAPGATGDVAPVQIITSRFFQGQIAVK